MSLFRAVALSGAAILCASHADAATIVQSGSTTSGGVVELRRFDPSVGSLNFVKVESSYQASAFFGYAEQFGDPVVAAVGSLGSSDGGLYNFSGLYASDRFDPGTISIFLNGTAQVLRTGDLSRYIGLGVLYLGGGIDVAASVNGNALQRINPPVPGSSRQSYTVTFDFTPTIPEPATWALMLAGFGMVGYAMRRRPPQVTCA